MSEILRCAHRSPVCLVTYYRPMFLGCVSVTSVCAGTLFLCVCMRVTCEQQTRQHACSCAFEGDSKVNAAYCALLHAQLRTWGDLFCHVGSFSGQDSGLGPHSSSNKQHVLRPWPLLTDSHAVCVNERTRVDAHSAEAVSCVVAAALIKHTECVTMHAKLPEALFHTQPFVGCCAPLVQA